MLVAETLPNRRKTISLYRRYERFQRPVAIHASNDGRRSTMPIEQVERKHILFVLLLCYLVFQFFVCVFAQHFYVRRKMWSDKQARGPRQCRRPFTDCSEWFGSFRTSAHLLSTSTCLSLVTLRSILQSDCCVSSTLRSRSAVPLLHTHKQPALFC